jgi:hypothetical protein
MPAVLADDDADRDPDTGPIFGWIANICTAARAPIPLTPAT